MKKLFTHWTFAFVTLFDLTWIGLQDPQVKEILRLKSFDLQFQSQQKEVSQDIAIVTIDEKAIELHGQWPWKRDVLAGLIEELRMGFVVAIACATRFWRITAAFRRNNGLAEPSSKAMREALERAWERSPR